MSALKDAEPCGRWEMGWVRVLLEEQPQSETGFLEGSASGQQRALRCRVITLLGLGLDLHAPAVHCFLPGGIFASDHSGRASVSSSTPASASLDRRDEAGSGACQNSFLPCPRLLSWSFTARSPCSAVFAYSAVPKCLSYSFSQQQRWVSHSPFCARGSATYGYVPSRPSGPQLRLRSSHVTGQLE